jgi:hypothetical protein
VLISKKKKKDNAVLLQAFREGKKEDGQDKDGLLLYFFFIKKRGWMGCSSNSKDELGAFCFVLGKMERQPQICPSCIMVFIKRKHACVLHYCQWKVGGQRRPTLVHGRPVEVPALRFGLPRVLRGPVARRVTSGARCMENWRWVEAARPWTPIAATACVVVAQEVNAFSLCDLHAHSGGRRGREGKI